MKQVGNYNNVSKELMKKIPVLKPGEEAVFEMLHGVKNPDPDPEEKRKNPVLFGKRQIPTIDRIFDPYANEGKGDYVDIIVAESWIKGEPTRSRMFVPGFGLQQFQGKFSLFGGKVEDAELYEFLMLTNTNQDNEHRDKSIEPLFKVVNTSKQVAAISNELGILRKALNLAAEITTEKCELILRSLNKPISDDPNKNTLAIQEIARKQPDVFLDIYNNPRTEKKALLKEAIELGVIVHQAATGKVMFNNNLITMVNTGTGADVLNALVDWFDTAANGQDVLDSIIKKLDKTKKKKAEPVEA